MCTLLSNNHKDTVCYILASMQYNRISRVIDGFVESVVFKDKWSQISRGHGAKRFQLWWWYQSISLICSRYDLNEFSQQDIFNKDKTHQVYLLIAKNWVWFVFWPISLLSRMEYSRCNGEDWKQFAKFFSSNFDVTSIVESYSTMFQNSIYSSQFFIKNIQYILTARWSAVFNLGRESCLHAS